MAENAEIAVVSAEPAVAPQEGVVDAARDTRRDTPGFDRSALEAKVAAGLKKGWEPDSSREEPEPESDEPVGEVVPQDEVEPEDVTPTLPGGEDDTEDDENDDGLQIAKEQQPKAGTAAAPTFPGAIKRSLLAYGWSEEEIDAAYKANPSQFLVTATKLHQNRNTEVASWAAMGRKAREQQESQDGTAVPKNGTPDAGGLKPVDVDALIEKHGNEDLVRELAGPVNEAIAQIAKLLPDLTMGVQSIQQARRDTFQRQVDEFFGGAELKPYQSFYGADSTKLTDTQLETRNKVLELADSLIYGAGQQGRNLAPAEAMLLAHDSVSSGFKAAAERAKLKSSVKTRGQGVTIRPSKNGNTRSDATGKPKTRDQLVSKVKSGLDGVFGS